MISLLFAHAAFSASIVDPPGGLQANIGLHNDFSKYYDRLFEANSQIGTRQIIDNQSRLDVEFGALDILSLRLTLPYTYTNYRFPTAQEMSFSPRTDTGSSIGGSELSVDDRIGKGLTGSFVGLRLYPFEGNFYDNRNHRGAWRLELGYRIPDATHFYTVNDNNQRGSGPGAGAFYFGGTFVGKARIGRPYIQSDFTLSSRWSGDIRDTNGQTLISNTNIRPASIAQAQAGSEVPVYQDKANDSEVALHFYGRFRYQSWMDIPSGIVLPQILPTTEDLIVTQTEQSSFHTGFGLNMHFITYYNIQLYSEFGLYSPQVLEHVYDTNTNGGLSWLVGSAFTFRYRSF